MPSWNYNSSHIGAEDYSSSQIGVVDYSSSQIGAEDYSSSQIGAEDYSSSHIGVDDYSSSQIGVDDYSSSQIGVDDYSSSQIGAEDYSSSQNSKEGEGGAGVSAGHVIFVQVSTVGLTGEYGQTDAREYSRTDSKVTTCHGTRVKTGTAIQRASKGDDNVVAMELDKVAVLSLLSTGLFGILAVIFGHFILGRNERSTERWIITWLIYDALTHFFMEGPFVILSLTGTVNASDSFFSLLWKEYGKADSRWLVSDPTIVSLEILTVVVDGLLCLVVIAGIITKGYYRHFAQVSLCVCEIYGGWMTFCPEWLSGNESLDTSSFLYLWVYLVFFNGIWIVVPALLLVQSWLDMKAAFTLKSEAQGRAYSKYDRKYEEISSSSSVRKRKDY
ncbi:hypothetical protein Btru_023050 [Bulinus truncatus]|nr:hypothetical protein Btru_023050 [Bulinus truncatus]